MPYTPLIVATLLVCWNGLPSPVLAQKPPTGFQAEMSVQQPTRLGWEFALSGPVGEIPRLPNKYDSSRQRYQLYVPPDYDAARAWPLVVFLSPGDDPLGWRHWQKPCEQGHVCFCAAYGAGAGTDRAVRTRIVLDVLDDVRRRYRIDPDQTYLTGFSSGASLAGTLAFALPECCGGVVAVCGGVELNHLNYLRLRTRARLSLVLITGPGDVNRRALEDYQNTYFTDLGIRTRLWRVPDLGHAMPGPDVLGETLTWLTEDLPRRRTDARERPTLSMTADETPTDQARARGMLTAAEAELNQSGSRDAPPVQADKLFHGVALLEGILARYDRTDAAPTAEQRLKEIHADPARRKALGEQRTREEKRALIAQGRALERAGDLRGALQAWSTLATARVGTAEGTEAAREMGRLKTLMDTTPYLGLHLEGESATVQRVLPQGPSEKAGLRGGDRLLKLGPTPIASLTDLRQALQRLKPGDRVSVTVQRGERQHIMDLEVGRPPG